jgi:hypothetical protein
VGGDNSAFLELHSPEASALAAALPRCVQRGRTGALPVGVSDPVTLLGSRVGLAMWCLPPSALCYRSLGLRIRSVHPAFCECPLDSQHVPALFAGIQSERGRTPSEVGAPVGTSRSCVLHWSPQG